MDTDSASAANGFNQKEEEEEDFTKAPDYDGHQPKPDYILSAEIYNHRIHLQYAANAMLTSILERDHIAFYELPESLKKGNSDTILMPCIFRDESYRQNFGYPIYLCVPRNNCKGSDIQEALQVKSFDTKHFLIRLLFRKLLVIFYHYRRQLNRRINRFTLHIVRSIKITTKQRGHCH